VPETSEQARQVIEAPTLTVGAVEGSGTDPIKAMMQLASATKQVTGNANLIRYHDILMDRAVNVLGRVEG
jgi:flagellar basal body rod protein FlgG